MKTQSTTVDGEPSQRRRQELWRARERESERYDVAETRRRTI